MYRVGLQRKETSYLNARLAIHAKGESHPDTGEGPQSCIFTAHQSGPRHIARTPEDPLIQDSLTHNSLDPNKHTEKQDYIG